MQDVPLKIRQFPGSGLRGWRGEFAGFGCGHRSLQQLLIQRSVADVEIFLNRDEPLDPEQGSGRFGMDRVGARAIHERIPKLGLRRFRYSNHGIGSELFDQGGFSSLKPVIGRDGPPNRSLGEGAQGGLPHLG